MWRRKLISFMTLLALVFTLSIGSVGLVFADHPEDEWVDDQGGTDEWTDDGWVDDGGTDDGWEEGDGWSEEDYWYPDGDNWCYINPDMENDDDCDECFDEKDGEFVEEICYGQVNSDIYTLDEEMYEEMYEGDAETYEEHEGDVWDEDDAWGEEYWVEYADSTWEDDHAMKDLYYEEDGWSTDVFSGVDEYGCKYWIGADGYVDSSCLDEDDLYSWGDHDQWDSTDHYVRSELDELYFLLADFKDLRWEYDNMGISFGKEEEVEMARWETTAEKWIAYLEGHNFEDGRPEGLKEFWLDDNGRSPWDLIEELWTHLHALTQIDDLTIKIRSLENDLAMLLEFIRIADQLINDDFKYLLTDFAEIIEECSNIIARMKNKIDSGEAIGWETTDAFWDIIWELEDDASGYTHKIVSVLDEDSIADLEEKYPEIWDTVLDWAMVPDDHNYHEDFVRDYGESDVFEELPQSVIKDVWQSFDSLLYSQLTPYLDDDVISNVISNIYTNLDHYDTDKINDLLSNHVRIRDKLDFEHDISRLDKLLGWLEMSFITDKYAAEIEDVLQEIRAHLEAGYTEDEISALLDELEKLLTLNEEEGILVERLEYYDVKANFHTDKGPEWYYTHVMRLTGEGVVSGYSGDLIGNYGPGDSVTIAEIIKMAVGVKDVELQKVSGDVHWAIAAGVIGHAKDIKLDKFIEDLEENLDRSATREEVAIIITEVMEWQEADCKNPFDDYDGDYCLDGVYENDVFEGDSETGDFAGERNINRAEAAKVIAKVLDSKTDIRESIEKFETQYLSE